MEYCACALRTQHNRQQTISPCLNFILIFDFGALLSEEFKVRYATACHMGKRFVVAYRLQNVAKLRQIYLIYKKNGENYISYTSSNILCFVILYNGLIKDNEVRLFVEV